VAALLVSRGWDPGDIQWRQAVKKEFRAAVGSRGLEDYLEQLANDVRMRCGAAVQLHRDGWRCTDGKREAKAIACSLQAQP